MTSIEQQGRQLRDKRKQRTQQGERKCIRARRHGGDSAGKRQEGLSRYRQRVTSMAMATVTLSRRDEVEDKC